ncbi:MAG: hypothetical protein P0107_07000 [Nitrosomonas sp.]|nr:hypothetical protein [Nitrosomonas sp.]
MQSVSGSRGFTEGGRKTQASGYLAQYEAAQALSGSSSSIQLQPHVYIHHA